jgi:TolB protein
MSPFRFLIVAVQAVCVVWLCAGRAPAQIGQQRMGIRVVRPDGTDGREVVSVSERFHHGSPCWSPDGTKLLFDAYRQGLQEPTLFVVDADGKNLKELGSGAYPQWSPDGNQVLFFSGLGQDPRISLMHADGSGRRELLAGAWPSWSGGGKQMLFSRSGPDSGIWTAGADGSNPRQVYLHLGVVFAPVWSPDGKRIAFASNAKGNFDLYTIDGSGADLKQLTTHPGMDLFPGWSPDGKRIAFTRYEGDTADVYLLDVEGGGESSVTSRPGFDIDPAWSPDGKWIAYGSQK